MGVWGCDANSDFKKTNKQTNSKFNFLNILSWKVDEAIIELVGLNEQIAATKVKKRCVCHVVIQKKTFWDRESESATGLFYMFDMF